MSFSFNPTNPQQATSSVPRITNTQQTMTPTPRTTTSSSDSSYTSGWVVLSQASLPVRQTEDTTPRTITAEIHQDVKDILQRLQRRQKEGEEAIAEYYSKGSGEKKWV
jgi:hypothetical protein